MKVNLAALESELKKRLDAPYTPWGRKQADKWDRETNFIYSASKWADLQRRIKNMPPEQRNYATNRWFNFWSAMGVEAIFCSLPGVAAAKNPRDRLVDFSIQGLKFDHKTSVFPKGYRYGPRYAAEHPEHLAAWLYQNQSRQRRFHQANRLFIILYDSQGQHWKLRAELSTIKQVVEQYISKFSAAKLIRLNLNANEVLTDIIWAPGKPGRH